MKAHWHVRNPDSNLVHRLSATLNCHPVTAAVLINRNIRTLEDANRFLNPSLKDLQPPFAMKDMDAAVRRIARAISEKENILIFGDYDADGITATAMLTDFFQQVGIRTLSHIPHRIKEGYSIQPSHVTRIAVPKHISLIITVDCGSSSHEAIKMARDAGIDVIVTDHHDIFNDLPPALAVINPKRADCQSQLESLSGIGVAFYLIIALRAHLRDIGFWDSRSEPNLKQFFDLVALGTVADMVPLLNENRILTKAGLKEIAIARRPGVKALVKSAGISEHSPDSQDIAFKLAPRLNAAGRIDHADVALQLLLADTTKTADDIAQVLNRLNGKRQEAENDLLGQTIGEIESNPDLLKKKSLVLYRHNWHEGIIGIVASKLVNRFNRPTVLISINEGLGKGSARSIPGFDLHKGLTACSPALVTFGGHAMAAGLVLKADQISEFQDRFEHTLGVMTTPDDFLPRISVDYELDLEHITGRLIDELESLQPFGTDNPEPVLLAKNARVISSTIVGQHHRRMRIGSVSGKNILNAIQFNIDPIKPLETRYSHILFKLNWNYWNGQKTAQIVIEDTYK